MTPPKLSVVMAVHNGGTSLDATIQSVLDQADCPFEFILHDDGSTDGTPELIGRWSRLDARVRLSRSERQGLTRSLIQACALARGDFIARQDAGDVSLAGRFARQVRLLEDEPSCVAVSCHTQVVGPQEENLFRSEIGVEELNAAVASTDPQMLRGPSHHGSMTFRRDVYHQVGGYRSAFYFAQDLDLWSRLIERGPFRVIPEVLYQAHFTPGSISGTRASEQRVLAGLIAQAAAARRMGQSEAPILQKAEAIRPGAKPADRRQMAKAYYFLGCCLRSGDTRAASLYFEKAWREDPTHWRAFVRLVQTRLTSMAGAR